MEEHREAAVSGHIFRKKRQSGDRWMAKWRDAGGQHQRVIGKAWTGRGRPPEGYVTKRGAQAVLDRSWPMHAAAAWSPDDVARRSPSPTPQRSGCAPSSTSAAGARRRFATTGSRCATTSCQRLASYRSPRSRSRASTPSGPT